MINNFNSRFKYGLIGFNHNEENNFYPGCDDEQRFEKNLKTQPNDWLYRNNPITYKYNSLGFRCIEHTELQDNYILFTGCSFTEGVALHLENTYPYIISQTLNKTYYNLALGGSGIDMLKNNLIMFLSLMKDKLPECVVIQWPDSHRSFLVAEDTVDYITVHYNDEALLFKELMRKNRIHWTNSYNKFYVLEYLKNLGIKKIVEIGDPGFEIDFYNNGNTYNTSIVYNMLFKGKDYARDLDHPGNLGHKLQAEEILNALNKM